MANADVLGDLDPFHTQIERVRVDLKEKVARAHQVLQERETALLSELQQLEDTYGGEGVGKQIDQLRKTKEQNIANLTDNENQEFLQQIVAQLDSRIRELEANLETDRDRIRQVELEWNENLEEILDRTGSIRVGGVQIYENITNFQTIRPIPEGSPTRGLKNLGNTDYMNCILQCLSHTLPLRQFYVSDEYKQYLNDKGDLSHTIKCVMIELWNTKSSYSVDTLDLKKQIKAITSRFPENSKVNSHEFMRFLLNELHEEINGASVEGRKSPADKETLGEAYARYLTWEDSRISELFSGMLRSEVCCSICSNQSIVYIPFMDIALPIPERKRINYFNRTPTDIQLVDCLEMFTTEEILDKEERPYCNKCMKLTAATKQITIAKLPRLLVIQLKRFSYHPKCTKLSTPVKFDYTWELTDIANTTKTYSLYGMVCHSGGVPGGHYIAYCHYSGIWRCFDDKITKNVSWEQVGHQEAYLLFYN